MSKYVDRMPLRAVRVANRVIVLSGIASLLGAFILALPDTRRPASQMPWYFWLLVVYMALIPLYSPPARLGVATAGMPRVAAWIYTVVAGLAAALIMFAAIVSPPSAMMVVILGLAVSYTLRGAQALLRKRRQPNRAPASK